MTAFLATTMLIYYHHSAVQQIISWSSTTTTTTTTQQHQFFNRNNNLHSHLKSSTSSLLLLPLDDTTKRNKIIKQRRRQRWDKFGAIPHYSSTIFMIPLGDDNDENLNDNDNEVALLRQGITDSDDTFGMIDNNEPEDLAAPASVVEIAAEIAEKAGMTMEQADDNNSNEKDPIMSSVTTTTTMPTTVGTQSMTIPLKGTQSMTIPLKGSISSGIVGNYGIITNKGGASFLQSKSKGGPFTKMNIIPPPPFVGGTKKMDGIFMKYAKGSPPLPLKGKSFLESLSKGTQVPRDGSESSSDSMQPPPPLKGTQISSGIATNNVGTGLPFMQKSVGEMKSPFTPPPPLKGTQVSPGATNVGMGLPFMKKSIGGLKSPFMSPPPLKGTQASPGAATNVGTGIPFMKKSTGKIKSPLSTMSPAIPLLSTPQLKGKDSFSGENVGSDLQFKHKSVDEMNTIMTPDGIVSDSDTASNDVVTINAMTDAEAFLRRQTVESTDKKIGTGASFDSTVSFTPPHVRYEPVFVDVEIEVIDDPSSSNDDDMDDYYLQKDRKDLGKQTTTQPMNLWSGESFYGTSSSRVYGIRSTKSGGSSQNSRVTKDRSDTVDDTKDSDEIEIEQESSNRRRIDDERRINEEKTRVANLLADAEAKLAQQSKEMEDERRRIKSESERVARKKMEVEKRALDLENTRAIEVRALEERLAEERTLTKRKLKEEQDKYLELERAKEMDVEKINQLLEKRLDARLAELKKEQSSLVVRDDASTAAGKLVLNNEDIAEIVGNPNDLSTNYEPVSADDISDTLAADVEQLQIVSLKDTEFDLNGPIDNSLSTPQGESEMKYPFVSLLRDSSPYIVNHRHSTIVYHIPGDLISSSARFNSVMDDISLTYLFGMKIVIVVGCRKQILGRLAMSTTTVDGYGQSRILDIRVTDTETLRIVEEEAGYCRFEVERMLNHCLRNKGADCNIVSGCFITAKKFGIVDGVDYKFTGYPKTLQTDRINKFHARNDVVLLTPLGFTKDGDALNVHSEALAAFTAGTLEASKLVYFSSKPMILRGSINAHSKQRLQMITRGIANQIMSHYGLSIDSKTGFPYWVNNIHKLADSLDSDQRSMILKMGWAVYAIEHGVERAHIISSEDGALLEELFTARQGYGTCISQDDYEAPHMKDWNDDLGIAYGLSEAGVVKL